MSTTRTRNPGDRLIRRAEPARYPANAANQAATVPAVPAVQEQLSLLERNLSELIGAVDTVETATGPILAPTPVGRSDPEKEVECPRSPVAESIRVANRLVCAARDRLLTVVGRLEV